MAEEVDPNFTIVEYMRDHSGYKCGYCKSLSTNFSHGMWAHRMVVGDYQDLIDRGWRRSGKYCYKPTMDKTCCPMYTIKCDASELKLSKSHKKVLKRMHRYLSFGDKKSGNGDVPEKESVSYDNQEYVQPNFDTTKDLSGISIDPSSISTSKGTCLVKPETSKNQSDSEDSVLKDPCKTSSSDSTCDLVPNKKPGPSNIIESPDPSKPPCRKSKLIRLERREKKLAKRRQDALERGESLMDLAKETKVANKTSKSLEDFLNEPLPETPAHKLELRLVRINPPEASFRASYNASYAVYRSYQLEIHQDPPNECDKSAYQNFLVDGPLVPWKPVRGPPDGYGSFHQQYWLDGRLIAVGVLDILPRCISSVYLYYDPDYSFLSLGTYASLRELALVRQLHQIVPSLKWYYMGFYIHSCPKMRYKGNYTPSYLLCPETYIWAPIEKAAPILDVSKYSRLNEDANAVDENANIDIDKAKILYDQKLLTYDMYRLLNEDAEDEEEVQEYASLVGATSAYNMILYRS